MEIFRSINDDDVAKSIGGASNRLVFVAPGVSAVVADALVACIEKGEIDPIMIVLDANEESCRLGYCDAPSLGKLSEAVPLFTMHQFRHLAATLLKENGASLSEMQLFLRHDEQKTTDLYAGHLDNSTTKQSEYLGNFWSGKLAEAAGA